MTFDVTRLLLERDALLANLTSTQERCTAQEQELRDLKKKTLPADPGVVDLLNRVRVALKTPDGVSTLEWAEKIVDPHGVINDLHVAFNTPDYVLAEVRGALGVPDDVNIVHWAQRMRSDLAAFQRLNAAQEAQINAYGPKMRELSAMQERCAAQEQELRDLKNKKLPVDQNVAELLVILDQVRVALKTPKDVDIINWAMKVDVDLTTERAVLDKVRAALKTPESINIVAWAEARTVELENYRFVCEKLVSILRVPSAGGIVEWAITRMNDFDGCKDSWNRQHSQIASLEKQIDALQISIKSYEDGDVTKTAKESAEAQKAPFRYSTYLLSLSSKKALDTLHKLRMSNMAGPEYEEWYLNAIEALNKRIAANAARKHDSSRKMKARAAARSVVHHYRSRESTMVRVANRIFDKIFDRRD